MEILIETLQTHIWAFIIIIATTALSFFDEVKMDNKIYIIVLITCVLSFIMVLGRFTNDPAEQQMKEDAEALFLKNHPDKIREIKRETEEVIRIQTYSNEAYVLPIKKVDNKWVLDSVFIKEL